jgi:hypothetical protein
MRRPPPAPPGEINHPTVDRFTLVHASIGLVYGLVGLHALVALALAIAWEVAENPLKAHLPRFFPHATQDTWRNAIGDVVAVMIGWALARAL